MKQIKTEDAVGHVLAHDLTQIIPGQYKGARFKKGDVIQKEDIEVLLSMGKEHLFILEMEEGMVHENDAARRMEAILKGENISSSDVVKEGKIELFSEIDGIFTINRNKLLSINAIDELMVATRKGFIKVSSGEKLAGTRVIPLVIDEKKLETAEAIAAGEPVLSVRPFVLKTAAVVTTGSEVFKGRIDDNFTPILKKKLKSYGIEVTRHILVDDDVDHITTAIQNIKSVVDLVVCTGGMSVDPDDNTPGAIKKAGAEIVTYGAPVLPGAMFLLGYFDDGTPIMGLPGCVMYAKTTIFDLAMPMIAADIRMKKEDFVAFGEGGLCLGCDVCHFPNCAFGK